MLWTCPLQEKYAGHIREAFFNAVMHVFREFEAIDAHDAGCCFELLRRNILHGLYETVTEETRKMFIARTSSQCEPFYLGGDTYEMFLARVREEFLTPSVREILEKHVYCWGERLNEIFQSFLECRRLHTGIGC
jgi:hypothetical protein